VLRLVSISGITTVALKVVILDYALHCRTGVVSIIGATFVIGKMGSKNV